MYRLWKDKSGNGHDASQSAGGSRPSPVANGQNGLQTLSFDGSADHLRSTTFSISQPFSVYAVAKSTGTSGNGYLFDGVTDNNQRSLLAFHYDSKIQIWAASWANTNLATPNGFVNISATFDSSNSRVVLNGNVVSGLNPSTRNLTNGITIGGNYLSSGDYFKGEMAEIIIFNKNHSDTEREDVEGYLAQKWGLTANLPAIHPHKSPSYFKSDSANGSGQSLDLSNGVSAIVQTGGTEDVFDGGSAFSTSLWVKGWPSAANESLMSKDNFSSSAFGNLQSWLDASNASFMATDSAGTPPANGDAIVKWDDLSGQGHHASTYDNSPVWDSAGFNSKPTVKFTDDTMTLDGSGESFAYWTNMTVAIVWKFPGSVSWTTLMGRADRNNNNTYGTWLINARRADLTPPRYRFRLNGPTTATTPEINTSYSAQIKSNNLLVFSYDGSNYKGWLNGTLAFNAPFTDGMRNTSFPLSLGGESDGGGGANFDLSEFIIFKSAVNDTNRVLMEGYLAHKWTLSGALPSGHTYKSSAPTFGGWAIERASTGTDSLALDMKGAGDEFANNAPINDDQWHHLTTTFGGGTKKVYVDGVEVGTASQTGSVTASIFKLFLGDPLKTTGTSPQIDDVRIYGVALTAAEVAAIYNEGENDVGAQKFSVTSQSTIQGTVGKSVAYQITTDAAYGMSGYNSAITYTLLNKPSWLSVNGSTGAVSGTPPSAGTYSFQAKATNTLGTGIKDVTITVSDYANWNYALPFTTDYAGGSALKDWNMLVRLSEDSSNGAGNAGFRYSQLSSNGGDLRFVSKAGEELKYEIANWDTAGESQVWVRVPSLASDENVTMYWGNTNAGLPAYANNGSVWDGYFGVYHLEGTTGSAVDSSPLSNNLPGVNAPVLEASGLSGTAYSSTSAANNGFISSALSGNIKAKNGTYSLWINHSPNVANKHFFGMEYNNDASNYLYVVGGTASANKARVWVAGGSTGFAGISTPTTTLSGGWQMLTLVINNGYAQVYVDGTADGSSAWYHPGLDAVSGLAIGRGTADAGPDATFDEATFSTAPRTADWLLASYNNQKPSSTYLNFGSLLGPISLDDADYTEIFGKKDTTITSYTVAHSGNGSFTATGLPPGLTINSATGIISGSTSVVGTQNITITATGTTAAGAQSQLPRCTPSKSATPPPSPSRWTSPCPATPVPPPLPTSPCLYP